MADESKKGDKFEKDETPLTEKGPAANVKPPNPNVSPMVERCTLCKDPILPGEATVPTLAGGRMHKRHVMQG